MSGTNLSALGLDGLKRGADDSALNALGLSGLLLGSLLLSTLLMQATVDLSPGNLSGIALHKERSLSLAGDEDESLALV